MANFRFLLDNCVRHLHSAMPPKQAVFLEEAGLSPDAPDDNVVEVASVKGLLIVTNNRRHFEQEVAARIAESSRKNDGCTQVQGLVVVVPSDAIIQERVFAAASKNLIFEGGRIGWKTVHELCLKVVIPEFGAPKVTRLPRCPHCRFADAKAS
jgi:hypothetical protein